MAGLLTRGLGLGTPLVLHGLGASSSSAAEVVTTTPYRDRQILKGIAELVRATDEFGLVTTSGPVDDGGQSAENLKLAVLELDSFEEESLADDPSATAVMRTVSYFLHIYVRDPDPDVRDDEVDRLFCVAANTINGISYLGETYLQWSAIRRGQYLPETGIERHLECTGEFVYVIDSWNTRNTDP